MTFGIFFFALVAIGLISAFVFFYLRGRVEKAVTVLYPFSSSTIGKDGTWQLQITATDRQPISCPSGKLNIVGAFFDVYDPNLVCTDTPSQGFITQCRANSSLPECQNLDSKTFTNTVCSTTGSGKCKPRDVSSYIAAACNGKDKCTVDDLNAVMQALPLPCNLQPSDADYMKLPSTVSNQTSKSGYYLHGIYSCVVDG